MKIVVIVNPVAGNGKGLRKWNRISKKLTIQYEVFSTTAPNEATILAKEAVQNGANIVVGVGGDGTMHEIIEAVSNFGHSNCIVAAISGGSGNDYAKAYPTINEAEDLQKLAQNTFHKVAQDVGRVDAKESKYCFMNNAGIGFDGYIAYYVNNSLWKKRLNKIGLGKLMYGFYVMKAVFSFPFFDVTVQTVHGKASYKNVWFVTVSNQPYFGGGMKISPTSKSNDGILEMTIVENIPRWKVLALFSSVYLGKHTLIKGVHVLQAKSFAVQTNTNTYRQVDGEHAGMTLQNEEDSFYVEQGKWNTYSNLTS